MSMVKISNMPGLWNTPTVEYNGIKLNITDVASGGSSKLLNLQINSSSVFAVQKNGQVVASGYTGSFSGTASYAINSHNSVSSSYAASADNAYYAETAMSSSHAVDSDYSISASLADLAVSSSYAANSPSSSYSTTASVAVNAISSSYSVTASYAVSAISSSYSLSSSFSLTTTSSSYSSTASYSATTTSASYAPTNVITPYNNGNLSGSTTFNFSNGTLQKGRLIDNITIIPPISGSEGSRLEMWLTPSGSNYTLDFNTGSILLPSDSALSLPKTLTANKLYIVLLKDSGTNWMLSSLVGGF